jgi:Tfp pilus assembly protein PilX
MKIHTPKNQQGAALAFTLMMLTLLTVAAVSMIRQNKVQIGIATNVAQQTVTFASVETALRLTQAALEFKRYVDEDDDNDINGDADGKAKKHCNSGSTHSVHLNTDVFDGSQPSGVTAQVVAEYCISNYINRGSVNNPKYSGNEVRCMYMNNERNLIIGSEREEILANLSATPPVAAVAPIPSADNVRACEKLNKAGGVSPNPLWTPHNANHDACQIEVYTLHVKLLDPTTHTERTVESKFEIDCSNDLNNTDD